MKSQSTYTVNDDAEYIEACRVYSELGEKHKVIRQEIERVDQSLIADVVPEQRREEVIGNAMTVAVLAGRRFAEAVHEHWEEVEGWLALGAAPRQATLDLARRSVRAALIPATDQTKTTGLVTLPGAFVGAIFGGVSPLEAGRFQIVVLAAIMAAGAVTAVLVVAQLAPVKVRPALPR